MFKSAPAAWSVVKQSHIVYYVMSVTTAYHTLHKPDQYVLSVSALSCICEVVAAHYCDKLLGKLVKHT